MYSKGKNSIQKLQSLLGWLIPFVLILLISLSRFFPLWVENKYSNGFYKIISLCLRRLTGWAGFSLGDMIYAILIVIAFILFIRLIINLVRKRISWKIIGLSCLKIIKLLLWVYIVFNIFWGLNYNRLGISYQFKLKTKEYSNDELQSFICTLVDSLNSTKKQLGVSTYEYPGKKEMLNQAFVAYEKVGQIFPFLQYEISSVKPSLLTSMVSYAGYSGYYNPFSGEAQVNSDLPKFMIPFVACHEMGHQLGYASESEASFVGYLAAIHSNNTLLRYSTYFDLFLTSNGEMIRRDFWLARGNMILLDHLVRKDIRTYREYVLGKKNSVEPMLKTLYDQYLKANQQQNGIDSYDEVVGWVIAFQKRKA
jgi:hypothetical protein